MKYFILEKRSYIRGHQHDMPTNEMCKNGFDDLATAEGAVAALELLNHRPESQGGSYVKYIIVQETEQSWPTGLGKEENAK